MVKVCCTPPDERPRKLPPDMPWIWLDDKFHHNAKVLAAGNAGAGLYARLLSWCGDELTDGFVPGAVIADMGSRAEIQRILNARRTPSGSGLIVPTEGGFLIPDFLEQNRPAAEVNARRAEISAARAAAGRAGGVASGATRRAKQTGSKGGANGQQIEAHHPIPLPIPSGENHHHPPPPAAPDSDGGGGSSVDRLVADVAAMHLMTAALRAGTEIGNRPAYCATVTRRLLLEHADDIAALIAELYDPDAGTGIDVAGWRLYRLSLGLPPVADADHMADEANAAAGALYGRSVGLEHLNHGTADAAAFLEEVCTRDQAFATAAVLAYEEATGTNSTPDAEPSAAPRLYVVPAIEA